MTDAYVAGTVGTNPKIDYTAVPSGGAVALDLYSTSTQNWSLVRYVSQGGNLVSGVAVALPTPTTGQQVAGIPAKITVIDVGDGTPQPLNQSLTYAYTFTTQDGTITTPALPVGASIEIVQDDLTLIILRILKAGLVALSIPAQFPHKPTVLHAMPIDGQPKLPIITVNQSYLGQTNVPLGQANTTASSGTNINTTTSLADRIYSIAVLTMTVEEREFYRDAIIGIFNAILGPILQQMGQDVSHDFHVDSGQVTKDNTQPGFYFAEAMLKINGSFNVIVISNYGIIRDIDYTEITEQSGD